MKTMLAALSVVIIGLSLQGARADEPKASSWQAVDGKVVKALDSGRWSKESVTLMRAIWKGFTDRARGKGGEDTLRSIGNVGIPNPPDMKVYVGTFLIKSKSAKKVEIKEDAKNFEVQLGSESLPAIGWNKSILFVTGDIVSSTMPSFEGAPHGSLEMYIVMFHDGRFIMMSLLDPSVSSELTKE